MTIVLLVTAWALVEAAIAIAMASRPAKDRPTIFTGLIDWRA